MSPKSPVSPYKKTVEILYFARLLDKARSHTRTELDVSDLAGLRHGFDLRFSNFPGVLVRIAGPAERS